jgi:hypothetical protein
LIIVPAGTVIGLDVSSILPKIPAGFSGSLLPACVASGLLDEHPASANTAASKTASPAELRALSLSMQHLR